MMIQKHVTPTLMLAAAVLTLMCADKPAESMNQLIPAKVLGWEAEGSPIAYDRQTIFDYIDGAGEIYLMYDFRKVIVANFVKGGQPNITLELFDMGKGSDAFGIFCHSRADASGDERQPDANIGQGSEFRGGLLYFWRGKYFACIYADEQTTESATAVLEIARDMEKRITERAEPPPILGVLPAEGLEASSVRYFHKYATLNYHYYLAEDNILDLDDQTEAVLGRYEPGGMLLLCVRYPDNGRALQAFKSFTSSYIPEAQNGLAEIESGKWVKAHQVEEYVLIAFDTPDRERADSVVKAASEKAALSEKRP